MLNLQNNKNMLTKVNGLIIFKSHEGNIMKRHKHPNKTIEEAIGFAEKKGWRCYKAGNSSHAWGRLLCPFQSREGCSMSIWSTPRDNDVHAMQIKRRVNQCPHS